MTATVDNIKERIRNYIVNQFLFGFPGDLAADDSLLEKGVIDSTGVLELVEFIESTFGFKVPDQDMIPAHLDGINRLASYVQERTSCN